MIDKPDICFYHANCADGFAAALAVWLKWPDIRFEPVSYDEVKSPSDRFVGSPELPRHVLFVDFWPGAAVAEQILVSNQHRLTVFDHHKSARDEINECMSRYDPQDFHAVFDVARSGAGIAWDEIHGGKRPRLIDFVEDRDLWRFAFGDASKQIHAFIMSFPMEFTADPWGNGGWNNLRRGLENDSNLSEAYNHGNAILRAQQQAIEALIAEGVDFREIDGHPVPVLNVPWAWASETGHLLLKHCPEAPFAATYAEKAVDYEPQIARVWSLRSEDGRQDVSEIAKRFGGGGHRNAAGFTQMVRPLNLSSELDAHAAGAGVLPATR